MNACFVYAYRNPLNGGVPFYVGKGSGHRVRDHMLEAKRDGFAPRANRHKISTIRSILVAGMDPIVQIVEENLSEERAFELEEFLIAEIGRADQGKGPLTNLSDGGEGGRGIDRRGEKNPNYGKRGENAHWWGRKHDEAAKAKVSAKQKGRVFSEEHKAAMRKPKSEAGRAAMAEARRNSSYRPSDETRQKLSVAMKGRPSPMLGRKHSDEHKARLSAMTKGVPKPKTPCAHCGLPVAAGVMARFHGSKCKEAV